MSTITAAPAAALNLYGLLFGTILTSGPGPGTPTSYTYGLGSSALLGIFGSGFTYGDPPDQPKAGSIAFLEFRTLTGDLLGTWSGIAASPSLLKLTWTFGGKSLISNYLAGADTIAGGAGSDYLVAGLGDDTIDGGGGYDEITFAEDASRTAGIHVDLSQGFSKSLAALAADPEDSPDFGEVDSLSGIESIWATKFADLLIGDAGANSFTPGLGSDTIDGGGGTDDLSYNRDSGRTAGITVDLDDGDVTDAAGKVTSNAVSGKADFGEIDLISSVETLWTTKFADVVHGDDRSMTFTLGLGNDTIDGGGGYDEIYYFRDGRTAGIDLDLQTHLVASKADSGKPDFGEVDTILGGVESIWATTFADTLVGDALDNAFTPDGGSDTVDGGDGTDKIDYARGAATRSAGIVVTFTGEKAATVSDGTGGTDTLSNIEIVVGSSLADTAVGTAGRQWIVGYSGNDYFDGGAGGDIFQGGSGNDTFIVDNAGDAFLEAPGEGADVVRTSITFGLAPGQEIERLETTNAAGASAINLFGNAFANTIVGNAGANYLKGGGGADILDGGKGGDTYDVDSAADVVIEGVGDAKDVDLVLASVSFTLAAGVEIEQLQAANLALTTPLALVGNGFDNTLIGNAGANVLDGGLGNDILSGGKGNDKMRGGKGSDVYKVENAGDTIVEGTGNKKDIDIVLTTVSYTLKNGVQVEQFVAENVKLKTALKLTGNALSQLVTGNAGANKIDGKGGIDVLIGNKGKDTFVFSTALSEKKNLDYIRDYSTKDDTVALENAIFKTVGRAGKLAKDAFVKGHAAADESDRIIYDPANGALFYDSDGTGAAKQVAFAILKKGLAVTASDFIVI